MKFTRKKEFSRIQQTQNEVSCGHDILNNITDVKTEGLWTYLMLQALSAAAAKTDVQAGALTNKEPFSSSKGQWWHLWGWKGMHKCDLH